MLLSFMAGVGKKKHVCRIYQKFDDETEEKRSLKFVLKTHVSLTHSKERICYHKRHQLQFLEMLMSFLL
jgi:hypothetical protein